MGLHNISTKTTILTISALTLCTTDVNSLNEYISPSNQVGGTTRIIQEFNTQAIDLGYIEEQYSTPVTVLSDSELYDITFFELVQKTNFRQEEISTEFLSALNKFEKLMGKKSPTKKRL